MAAAKPKANEDWVGDRLHRARTARELSQTALAKKAGVGQTTIHALEKHTVMTSRNLPKLAQALGVRLNWLSQGTGPMEDTGLENPDIVSLYVLTFKLIDDYNGDLDALAISEDVVDRPLAALFRPKTDHKSLFAVEMEPRHPLVSERIHAGDTLVFNRARKPQSGELVLIHVGAIDQIMLREVRFPDPIKKPKRVRIVAATADESDVEITLDRKNHIIGVADTIIGALTGSAH